MSEKIKNFSVLTTTVMLIVVVLGNIYVNLRLIDNEDTRAFERQCRSLMETLQETLEEKEIRYGLDADETAKLKEVQAQNAKREKAELAKARHFSPKELAIVAELTQKLHDERLDKIRREVQEAKERQEREAREEKERLEQLAKLAEEAAKPGSPRDEFKKALKDYPNGTLADNILNAQIIVAEILETLDRVDAFKNQESDMYAKVCSIDWEAALADLKARIDAYETVQRRQRLEQAEAADKAKSAAELEALRSLLAKAVESLDELQKKAKDRADARLQLKERLAELRSRGSLNESDKLLQDKLARLDILEQKEELDDEETIELETLSNRDWTVDLNNSLEAEQTEKRRQRLEAEEAERETQAELERQEREEIERRAKERRAEEAQKRAEAEAKLEAEQKAQEASKEAKRQKAAEKKAKEEAERQAQKKKEEEEIRAYEAAQEEEQRKKREEQRKKMNYMD